jgi:UDP-glucuronate decarboxylase
MRFQDPDPDIYVGAHTHEGSMYREVVHEGRRKAAIQLGCLDEKTELFTDRGWIGYKQIQPSDEVLSIRPNTEDVVWSGIEKIHTYDGPSKMLSLKTQRADMLVTPNHRVLHRRDTARYDRRLNRHRVWSDYRFEQAHKLTSGQIAIPLAETGFRAGVPLSLDELRLAGLFVTDGSYDASNGYKNRRPLFIQRKSNHEKICSLLENEGLEYSVRFSGPHTSTLKDGTVIEPNEEKATVEILSESRERFHEIVEEKGGLPDWSWSLTDEQFDAFLWGLIEGDGTWQTENSYNFYNKKAICDQLQALCSLHGYSANMHENVGDENYYLSICDTKSSKVSVKDNWEVVDYEGEVWCLTVPHGNFLVRRNGYSYFTGNSYKVYYDYAREQGYPGGDGSTACAVILHDDGSMHGMADLKAAKRYMQAIY